MPVTPTESALPTPASALDLHLPERHVVAVRAVLVQGRYSWLWVVPACPYCGKQHDHFGGPLDGDPQSYADMSFVARCDSTDRGRFAAQYSSGALWYRLLPSEEPRAARDLLALARS